MLDLTHTDIATEEDKLYQLDRWANLPRATTWEELNMLVQNNEYLEEAATTVYQLSQEERIRMACEAREDYLRTQRGIQNRLAKSGLLEKEIKAQADEINCSNCSPMDERQWRSFFTSTP